jgi:hypothetical protein
MGVSQICSYSWGGILLPWPAKVLALECANNKDATVIFAVLRMDLIGWEVGKQKLPQVRQF